MTGTLTTDARRPRASTWRLTPVVFTVPLLTTSLGVDGGAIFQILAVENLGIGAAPLGIAFGLGVVSVPVQLAAARIRIRRARRNLQWFLVACALQTWLLGALVAVGAGGPLAAIALVVTVVAELLVSILFATAWQPLLTWVVDADARQRLNSVWAAGARGVLAAAVATFGMLDSHLRPVFLVGVGVLALATAKALDRLPVPEPPTPDPARADASPRGVRPLRPTFVAIALINLGAMPLWLVYIAEVAWPDGSLGVIAAVQIVAATLALVAWRPTHDRLVDRARTGTILIAVAVVSVTVVDTSTTAGPIVVLAASALTSAGTSWARIALIEHTHQHVDTTDAVRAFTVLDVVASTSLQAGLVLAGLLITLSRHTPHWTVDPYEVFLITTAAAALVATHQLRRLGRQAVG